MASETKSRSILVIDDEPEMRSALAASIKQMGFSVITASRGEEALLLFKEKQIEAILTDFKLPQMNGMEFFQEIQKTQNNVPVIMMSAYGTIHSAVDAMKSGIFDYLVKPFSQETLESSIRRALALDPREPVLPYFKQKTPLKGKKQIISRDMAMVKILKLAEVVAASQATILIEGESGTGKELFARYIHENSPRAHRPFIAINCAAVPETLLESELFGYEKGAFTGANSKKPGKFELAHTGTILLDEVSEMPLHLQAKLLRVLQEREVELLGGRDPIALDIRIIATTNRPIWEEVKAGRFREDLYYRLNVFPLRLPPLRNRLNDIPLLFDYFVQKNSLKYSQKSFSLSPEALSYLTSKKWQGNVREFENVMERAFLLAQNGIILPEHIMIEEDHARPIYQKSSIGDTKTVWEAERELILETLEKSGGNRTQTAKILGISIRTLRNKLRDYRESGNLIPSTELEIGKKFPGGMADFSHDDQEKYVRGKA
ncbi:MAG: sigma-54-dependent transcriptional regulator [Nitrospiria bacterium]